MRLLSVSDGLVYILVLYGALQRMFTMQFLEVRYMFQEQNENISPVAD